ncbi:junctional adhesion molecule B-like [Anguilla rostrata]|uniref:junctional adhesion molecule B-like n=1 Tax=Anguilla rostrata TaxID=7938 RepID=UPI0030CCED37
MPANPEIIRLTTNHKKLSGGETVELTCRATCTHLTESNSFIWYKNEQLLTEYYRFYQSYIKFTARKWVTQTCKITCTDLTGSQTFIWYKNGQSPFYTAQKYQFHNYLQFKASSGDAGSYSCAVRGHENLPSPAVTLYPPQSILLSVSSSGEIVEGSSVTLTCSSDANPPVHYYTWFKNNRAVSSETGGPEDSYTIKNITLQDAGEYTCQAGNGIGTNRSPPKRLDVQLPSWSRVQYYCLAQNTHGAQTSTSVSDNIKAGDKTVLVWTVVGISVAFALFTVMVCTSRKKSTNRERRRSRRSLTSRAFRE